MVEYKEVQRVLEEAGKLGVESALEERVVHRVLQSGDSLVRSRVFVSKRT